MNEEQFTRLSCSELRVNDLLVARMPDPVGRACLVPDGLPRSATVVDVAIVRSGDELLQRFLCLVVNDASFRQQAQSLLTGTTRQRISRGNLSKIAFKLPPLPVQRRIVDLMAHLDNQIANLRTERDAAEELVQALVRHSLSTFLDTQTVSLDTLVKDGVVELGRGHVISKIDLTENPGEFPVYSSAKANNGSIGAYGLHMFDEELITWSVDGGGHLFHRPKHKFSVTNIGGYLRILQPDVVSYKYLSVVLRDLHSRLVFDWQSKAHPSVIRFAYSTIPLPAIELQNGVERLITPSESLTAVLALEIDRLMMLRASLTSCLLSCEIQIPDAYDSLLDGVA